MKARKMNTGTGRKPPRKIWVTAGDGIVAKYGDHILMADRYWNGGFIAGIYEFVETPEETGLCECECRLNLIETSEGTFPDGGHALEWAISRVK